MTKIKNLPISVKTFLDSRSSGATLSFPSNFLDTPPRETPKNQAIADIISGDRREFSKEYIAPNAKGKLILKSDKYIRVGDDKYEEVEKSKNPDHHIENPLEIDDRLNSIVESMKNKP